MEEKEIENKIDKLSNLLKIKIQQHSGHQSDILAKIDNLDKRLQDVENNFNTFRKEVNPMVIAFNSSEQYKMVWGKTGITIKKTAQWIIIVSGALVSMWALLKYGINSLLK